MKYRYRPYADQRFPNGDLIVFPLVNLTLKKGRRTLSIDCLVDSGASQSLFNTDIAELLEIDLTKAARQNYVGIGNNTLEGYRSSVSLKLSGFDTWVTFEAGFVEQNEMPLLGHAGFFENYEITFRAYQNRFEIKSAKPDQARRSSD